MAFKLDSKITGFSVVTPETEAVDPAVPEASNDPDAAPIEHMNENVGRPEMLVGATYKIKPPLSDHALYITVNDIVLNPDTDHEVRRPYEVFVNSKNMDHYQWVVALTRVMSAVFRKGGDVTFLVEELKAVFDPKGGYYKGGGKFMPSLVAEIGEAIETHMITIGLLQPEVLGEAQQKILQEKKTEYEARKGEASADGEYPPSATLCNKCHMKAVILMDGCMTCLACGDSKCG
ncbi:MAG: NrdJb [Pseudomonadota bacterium]